MKQITRRSTLEELSESYSSDKSANEFLLREEFAKKLSRKVRSLTKEEMEDPNFKLWWANEYIQRKLERLYK